MIESGLVDHWMKKYWPSINRCSADNLSKAGQPMNLDDTQSAFFLVFLGLGLAAMTLLVEVIINLLFTRYKSKQFRSPERVSNDRSVPEFGLRRHHNESLTYGITGNESLTNRNERIGTRQV